MRAYFASEAAVFVVQPFVLQRVAHNALNVKASLVERHGFLPLVHLQGQSRAPLHDAIRTGVVSGSDVFDAAILIDLIFEERGPELDVQAWFEKRVHCNRAINSDASRGRDRGWNEQLHQAI